MNKSNDCCQVQRLLKVYACLEYRLHSSEYCPIIKQNRETVKTVSFVVFELIIDGLLTLGSTVKVYHPIFQLYFVGIKNTTHSKARGGSIL